MRIMQAAIWQLITSMYVLSAAKVSSDFGALPRVTTRHGVIIGSKGSSISGKIFHQFLGIPFGKVNRRFEASFPADPWEGELLATRDGPDCKQLDILFFRGMVGQEDCLTLNVYTPEVHSDIDETFPVIVYLHGGYFMSGTASSLAYGPRPLMDFNVVVVVPHYRLGFFGFLSTGDSAAPGNNGLLDQQLALHWVQSNIGSFGGDADRVTLMGQSAGAAAVLCHMIAPSSRGLFSAAILQSGSALVPFLADPRETAKSLGQKLSCGNESDTSAMVECLRYVNADALALAALEHFGKVIPVIDTNFLPEHPYAALRSGRFHRVPVIIGNVRDESTPYHPYLFPVSFGGSKDSVASVLRSILEMLLAQDFFQKHSGLEDSIVDFYLDGVDLSEEEQLHLTVIGFFNDMAFFAPNNMTMDLLSARNVAVYSYIFDYFSKSVPPLNARTGVYHLSDTFYNFELKYFAKVNYSERDRKFMDVYNGLLVNFAYFRDPTPLASSSRWVLVEFGVDNGYLEVDQGMQMKRNFRARQMTFWQDILLKKYQYDSTFIA